MLSLLSLRGPPRGPCPCVQVAFLKSVPLRMYAGSLAYHDSAMATRDAMRVRAQRPKAGATLKGAGSRSGAPPLTHPGSKMQCQLTLHGQ